MLKKEIKEIIEKSKKWGWVLEPDAQKIFLPLRLQNTEIRCRHFQSIRP